MQVLVVLRGSPGAGKSHWIKKKGLEQYTLSADTIRLMLQSPVLMPDGNLGISQRNDNKVWDILFHALETRMERGEFVIIDATHSRASDFSKYKKLIEKYKYRMYCVDFSDVPIDLAKERNRTREAHKLVPEHVIDNMYARMKAMQVPKYCTVIKPEDYDNVMQYKITDYSQYKKINHIGDIHGCYTVLEDYFREHPFKDDQLYIFCGDYVDRGIENGKVVKFLMGIYDKPNVILLKGNHEIHLWNWANDQHIRNRKFVQFTVPELEAEGIEKADVRQLYRKMAQTVWYQYHERKVLVCHGGLSMLPKNLLYIATDQLIYGVGKYEEMLDVTRTFTSLMPEDVYHVFGHRNNNDDEIVQGRCRNVCEHVEFGGSLRVWSLSPDSEECIYIKNTVFKPESKPKELSTAQMSVESLIESMETNSQYVSRKNCGDGIFSYSFNRAAFKNDIWPGAPRGLFIDSRNSNIVARGYNKFHNIGQRGNELSDLKKKMVFPATAYIKENGFLGLVGYDHANEKLFISSKTDNKSDHTKWLQDILIPELMRLESYSNFVYDLKFNNYTAVFECLDPENDPHIIESPGKVVVLLDLIYNTPEFKRVPYTELKNFTIKHGLFWKIKACEFSNWEDFEHWYNEVSVPEYKFGGHHIEGFVIEDSNGFMTKVKLDYYLFWKAMRGLQATVKSGKRINYSKLYDARMNDFLGFLLKKKEIPGELDKSIIELRIEYEIQLINEKDKAAIVDGISTEN